MKLKASSRVVVSSAFNTPKLAVLLMKLKRWSSQDKVTLVVPLVGSTPTFLKLIVRLVATLTGAKLGE